MFDHGNKVKSKLKKQKKTTSTNARSLAAQNEKSNQNHANEFNAAISQNQSERTCQYIFSCVATTTTKMKDKFNASKLKFN